jgi:hypothetical protein
MTNTAVPPISSMSEPHLALLKKDDKTSINDHINRFEQLVYEVNYNKPANTPNMVDSVVNLKFLNTLMTDKSFSEKWETFINAKGPQLEQMSTKQLYAEVRVDAARNKQQTEKSVDVSEAKALTSELQQVIQALNTRFDGRNNGNKSKGKGQFNQSQNQGNYGRKRKRGQNYNQGQRSGKKRRYPYDAYKYCTRHDVRGHSIDECHTAKRERRQQQQSANSCNTNPNSNFKSSYQLNFNRSRDYTVNTMRLIVNATAAESTEYTGDSHAWIVDSAGNAYITPFKDTLHNYHEFTDQIRVKGFAGKSELARGTGSVILTDKSGKRFNLKDVVYVPERPDQILSLMKLRREQKADFWFTAIETFKLKFPKGVRFSGKSVNDICYIWTSPSPALLANAVTTRNAAKRVISSHESNHAFDDEAFEVT